jgi:transcriptional regulator with XRE-family HTH domain
VGQFCSSGVHNPAGTAPPPAVGVDSAVMDSVHLLRSVRRHLAANQRELAALAGVSKSTVGRWECGASAPTLDVVARLLAAADLDLILAPRIAAQALDAVTRHLHLSLTHRLRLACGHAWAELLHLTAKGAVVLHGDAAHAVWLPVGSLDDIRVAVHGASSLPPTVVVRATAVACPLPEGLVPVRVSATRKVWVGTPGALAAPDERSTALRHADRLLHESAPLDDAGRRRPPHRDPDEQAESWRMWFTKSVDPWRIPRPDDSRAWRLGAAASLAQQLREQ